jgi:hypothetical protein
MNARIDHIYTMLIAIAIFFLHVAALPAQNPLPKQEQTLQTVQEKERGETQNILMGGGAVLALFVALTAFIVVKSRKDVQAAQNSLAATTTELVQTK